MVDSDFIKCQLSEATTIVSISNTQVDVLCSAFAAKRQALFNILCDFSVPSRTRYMGRQQKNINYPKVLWQIAKKNASISRISLVFEKMGTMMPHELNEEKEERRFQIASQHLARHRVNCMSRKEWMALGQASAENQAKPSPKEDRFAFGGTRMQIALRDNWKKQVGQQGGIDCSAVPRKWNSSTEKTKVIRARMKDCLSLTIFFRSCATFSVLYRIQN